jgi:hypothetical protein
MDIQTDLQKPSKSKLWIVSTIWANIIIVSILLGLALKLLSLLIEKAFGLSGFLFLEGGIWPVLKSLISISALVYAIRLGVKSVLKESAILQEDIKKISIGVVSVLVFFQLAIAVLVFVFAKAGFRLDIYFDFLAADIGYFVLTYFWLHKFNQYQADNRMIKYLSALAIIIFIAGVVLAWGSIKLPSFSINSALNSDETAGWETYTNKKYGFQFKYPAGTDILSESDKPVEMGVLLTAPTSFSTNLTIYELKLEEGQKPSDEPTLKIDIVTEAGWLEQNFSDLKFNSGISLRFFSVHGKNVMEVENPDEKTYKMLVIQDKDGFNIIVRQSRQTDFLDSVFKTFTLIDKEAEKSESRILEEKFSYPYPVSWQEEGVTFNLTGISLGKISAPSNLLKNSGGYYEEGEEVYALTLVLEVKTPETKVECMRLNLRRELNEKGDMVAPNTDQFHFPNSPNSMGCVPAKNITYTDQKIIFVVPESENKISITTGGESNIYFTIWKFSTESNLQLERDLAGEGLKELAPYAADVSYCYDAYNNRYPTFGSIESTAQIWFVEGGCPHEKYYSVIPGTELRFNIYTHATSGWCEEYGRTCPCLYPDFSLYEYMGGIFKKVKDFDFPDISSLAEAVYYTPVSEKIKIVAEKCFMLQVFQAEEPVRVSPYSDLVPVEITTPYVGKSIEAGDTVIFKSGIRNLGLVPTGDFNSKWFVDGVLMGTWGQYGLGAGETVISENTQYAWTSIVGTHKIKFTVDADNHVRESDESNNSITKIITVYP